MTILTNPRANIWFLLNFIISSLYFQVRGL